MNHLAEIISRELLPYVTTPGQYIGLEINQLPHTGDWKAAKVRVALAFPDTYAIGMSHLGQQILYWLCNQTHEVTAERVYCPWIDAEARMREKKIPLFTWDTRQPVSEADILAVSLQYEMTFTNLLTILDLASIPFRASQRDDNHPLVIAGGPQVDAPEPIADFVDLVVLGDGEASMTAIIDAYKEYQANGVRRRDMIGLMARRFPWAYAPSLYDPTYHDNGTLQSFKPQFDELPSVIARCKTPNLNDAVVPEAPLVPHVSVVHDRVAIEIMRGCPQQCRFCHAGHTKLPLKMRSVDEILNIAEKSYRATGCDEIGLLSLSSGDYPQLTELTERINARYADRRVGISLPSLRVDKMLSSVPSMVNSVRKSGLTIAVEAGQEDMRRALYKKVTDGNLLDGVTEAFKAGWKSVKLYFMAGFPSETEEDIDAICEISQKVADAGRTVRGNPARVSASVGWLVPKPHTPLQWAAQPIPGYFEGVAQHLRDWTRSRRTTVRFKTHNIARSRLEAVFSRGDRRLTPVIEAAWEAGSRFDGWEECFSPDIWQAAFEQMGVDPAWYANRERSLDEVLPWAHMAGGTGCERLRKHYSDFLSTIQMRQENRRET